MTVYKSALLQEKRVKTEKAKKAIQKNPSLALYDRLNKPVAIRLPLYVSLLFIGIWLFIVICVLFYFNAFINYGDFRKWWNKNNGKQYKRVFSIDLWIQYQAFSLGYQFLALFYSEETHFQTSGEVEFLTQMMSTYAPLVPSVQTDKSLYFLMPFHICESIVVGTLDNSKYQGISGFENVQWSDTTGWPVNTTGWNFLLQQWGVPQAQDGTIDNNKWTNSSDNFLWNNYKLPAQTSFILSFMWNTKSDLYNNAWYPYAFPTAVGLNAITGQNIDYSGGWWGFCKYGFGTEKPSYQTIISVLYATEKLAPPPTSNNKCTSGKQAKFWGSSILSGLASALGIAAFLIPGGQEIGAWALAGIIGGGLATTGSGVLNGYQSCGS